MDKIPAPEMTQQETNTGWFTGEIRLRKDAQ